jgi:phosphomannomutase
MTLIKSISGIRGTIGGTPGDSLTPLDMVRFTSAFGTLLKKWETKDRYSVVIGRDARVSGEMASMLVAGTLMGMGIHVTDLGFASTPTTEIGVTHHQADGGIILTASHNPGQWNALKLLNKQGEFISAREGADLLDIASLDRYDYAEAGQLGKITRFTAMDGIHIDQVIQLDLVDTDAITRSGFRVAIDCVNSVGGIVIPALLKKLGVKEIIPLYCEPSGIFPHNPEPLPKHLGDISETVKKNRADVGFVVDPDVDRLVIINGDGSMFGEEYTLVAVADYVLQHTPGNTVSNLSSTLALRDITGLHGGSYSAAAVGEVNVVNEMKRTGAVIGGEGNGGVIYPALHYGRDALVGIALFLSYLARSGKTPLELRKSYPDYYNSKNKIELKPGVDVDDVIRRVREKYKAYPVNDADGIRIDFDREWVHLRKSNTEPIIRIISESSSAAKADALAGKLIQEINEIIN